MFSLHSLRHTAAALTIITIAASVLILPVSAVDPTPAPTPGTAQLGTPAPPYPNGPAPSEFPVPANGTPGRLNFAISPLQIETDFATKTGNFRVDNHSQFETIFTVVCYTYTLTDTGITQIIPDPTNIAGWFQFTQPTFILEAGTGTTVPFTVTIPPDAAPGDHFVGVQITGQATDKAVASMGASGGFQMRTPAAVQVLIIDRVPGQLTSKITASLNVQPFSFVTGGSFDFVTRLHDDGNTAVLLSGGSPANNYTDRNTPTITLTGGIPFLNSDKTIYAINNDRSPADFRLLPGTGRNQVLSWTDIPIIAHYDYAFTLPGSVADNRQAVTIHGSFWVVNVIELAIAIVVLFILIALIAFWRCQGRHNRAGKATKLAVAATARRHEMQREKAKREEAQSAPPPSGDAAPKSRPKPKPTVAQKPTVAPSPRPPDSIGATVGSTPPTKRQRQRPPK
jgi:hypothetical protein